MKLKNFTFSAFTFTVIFCLIQMGAAYTNDFQPPAGNTGAPGETTCAQSSCHGGSATPTSAITLGTNPASILATGYTPGTLYNIALNVNALSAPKYGFELTVLDGNNDAAGTLALTSAANTALATSGGRQYISHKDANSTAAWAFKWTAPAQGTGSVTFYVAANKSNNNGSDSGDLIFVQQFTFVENGANPCTSGTAGLSVSVSGTTATFTNTSTGGISSSSINYGDGQFGPFTGATQTHTYANNAAYTAVLTILDSCGATSTSSASLTVGTVGIADNNAIDFGVFPNPVNNFFVIDLGTAGVAEVKAELYNLAGQLVQNVALTVGTTNRIERGNLESGLYLLKVTDADGNFSTKKLLLN